MHINVVDYNPHWAVMYAEEEAKIKDILKQELSEIHHIGSTSVKGLKAKPIIDIMPVVYAVENVDQYNSLFEELGYECMGEFGIPNRRYFRKGGDDRTHQIHIFEAKDVKNIERHLAVRDYLRTHSEEVKTYGELKQELAAFFPKNIDGYCDGKDSFMKYLESKAIEWSRSR